MIQDFPYRVILGSQSPRRHQLLKQSGLDFEVKVLPTEEIYDKSMPPHEVAEFLARKKASAFEGMIDSDQLVITADSIVVQDGVIYEKPKNKEHAIQILSSLSGKTHTVFTGVCFKTVESMHSLTDRTQVTFDILSLEEIEYYIETCQPFDKAGAYGIQDWMGLCKVLKIQGSYPNVMGLPVHRVYEELNKMKVII